MRGNFFVIFDMNHPSSSLFTFFFLNRVVLPHKSGFLICVFLLLLSSYAACLCCHLVWHVVCVILIWLFGFGCLFKTLLCVDDSNINKVYLIR